MGILKRVQEARARHRDRSTPSGFGFALADGIDYLDPTRWDVLTGSATVFLSRRYLLALEETRPSNLRPRYAMVFRGRTAVAAIAAQCVTLSGTRVGRGTAAGRSVLRKVAHTASKLPLAGLEERMLVCGNLLSWGPHGVAFAPGEDPALLWPAVAEALYRLRRADRLFGDSDFMMVKDVTDAAAEALRRYSYRPLETEPDMILELAPEWRTLEDYLAGLNKKYRKAATGVVDGVEKAGIRVDSLGDLSRHAEALHALYLEVHENAPVRPVTLPAGYLPALASVLGDRFRCTVARRDDRLVGFVTTVADGETAVGYYMGFDRAESACTPIYLRLLQAVIGDALALGCRRVSLGRTALEPKARLGARPQPLRCWVRHRVPAVNLVVGELLATVPHDEAPERSPFR